MTQIYHILVLTAYVSLKKTLNSVHCKAWDLLGLYEYPTSFLEGVRQGCVLALSLFGQGVR